MSLTSEQDTRWMEMGACAGRGDDSMFPEGDGGSDIPMPMHLRREIALSAKETCATCTVSPECLAYALANKEPAGVWGGLDAAERTDLLKQVTELAS